MGSLFDALEAEWASTASSPAAAGRLHQWAVSQPSLAPFRNLAELAVFVAGSKGPAVDRVLLALARHACDDELAARALLQLLLPGCRALVSRQRGELAWEEASACVVEEVYEQSRAYRTAGLRPWVACRILRSAGRALERERRRNGATHTTLDSPEVGAMAAVSEPPEFRADLEDLLDRAVRHGHASAPGLRLVALTRVCGLTLRDAAAADRCPERVAYQRRRRAEHGLRAALGAAHPVSGIPA